MLYLHCGWPRTGTSSLQAALYNHRGALAAAGTVFPEQWMPKPTPTHHGLSELLSASQRSEGAAAELWAFLDAHCDRDVLFSAEILTTWLLEDDRQETFLRFLATTRDVMPTVCIWTLRRLEDAVASLYLRRLSLGVELDPPAEALGNFQEPNDLFAGMQKVEDVVDDTVYVKYHDAGAHNAELLEAFGIAEGPATQIRDELEHGPRLNTSLSCKQAAALLHIDRLSARAGAELDASAVRAAIARGDLSFDDDCRCALVADAVREHVRERALSAARKQGFTPYLDFFGEPAGVASSVRLEPELLTDDDLQRLVATRASSVAFEDGTLKLLPQGEMRPRGSLAVSEARDLLVVPALRGAYEPGGDLAEDTLRLWGDRSPDAVPERLLRQEVVHVYEDEVVWGGAIAGHYGHFLTEFVSRLWPLLPGGELEGLPVVFTERGEQPFAREWLDSSGFGTADLPRQGAVRFTRMFVPEPALQFRSWIAPEIRDVHLHARAGMQVQPRPRQGVTWLSRQGIDRERVSYDEGLLEWLIGEHVSVIRPENMTLPDQIGAIEASNVVAGVLGSAFHTMLLAEDMPRCLYLCPPKIVSMFAAQDALLGIGGSFVQALAPMPGIAKNTKHFPGAYRLMVPEVLRVLNTTILPELFDDRRVATLAFPERLWSQVGERSRERSIEIMAARVMLNPFRVGPRMALGEAFEAEGLDRYALEQFLTVSDLAPDHPDSALRAARLLKA